MTFQPIWEAWGFRFNPHLVFETLAYFIAARVYFVARRRDPVPDTDRVTSRWPVVGALAGAAIGSRLLSSFVYPEALFDMGGKTIVGAILGGWAGVEIAKKASGIRASTGDAFVPALAIGTAVGRLGCFFSGLADGTHGKETTLPWAMDLGDGLLRHPAALYEVAVVLVLGGLLGRLSLPEARRGDRFRLYVAAYLLWRLIAESWKTQPFWLLGLSAIQVACLAGMAVLARDVVRIFRTQLNRNRS